MVMFQFFQMAAVAILGFRNFKILIVKKVMGLNCVRLPNFVSIGQTFTEIWRFLVFRPQLSRIFSFEILMVRNVKRVKCVTVPNFVPISQTVAEMR